MNVLLVNRALAIYGTIANSMELKGTRERLSRQLRKVFLDGEHDPHRLTGSRICRASIANGTANRRPKRLSRAVSSSGLPVVFAASSGALFWPSLPAQHPFLFVVSSRGPAFSSLASSHPRYLA